MYLIRREKEKVFMYFKKISNWSSGHFIKTIRSVSTTSGLTIEQHCHIQASLTKTVGFPSGKTSHPPFQTTTHPMSTLKWTPIEWSTHPHSRQCGTCSTAESSSAMRMAGNAVSWPRTYRQGQDLNVFLHCFNVLVFWLN